MQVESLKCVVVGDGSVGKTCLLIRYAKDEFPEEYKPTVFDSYSVKIPIGDDMYELHLFDTAGQEDFDQLRRLAFSNTDILLVCFSVDLFSSYVNVRELWAPEIKEYCKGVPYLLVGTKIDLRDDPKTLQKLAEKGKSPISKQQGENLAREIGAIKYVECSALTKENVNDVFQEAVLATVSERSNATSRPKEVSTLQTVNSTRPYNERFVNDDERVGCKYCRSQNCTIL